LQLITGYSDFLISWSVERYWRSNSKIVRNRAQCWLWVGWNKTAKLFASEQNFTKFCTRYHPYLAARHMTKFYKITSSGFKLFVANTVTRW